MLKPQDTNDKQAQVLNLNKIGKNIDNNNCLIYNKIIQGVIGRTERETYVEGSWRIIYMDFLFLSLKFQLDIYQAIYRFLYKSTSYFLYQQMLAFIYDFI